MSRPGAGLEPHVARALVAVCELPSDDLLALTAALVEVPSVSHHEALLADLVEARLRARAPRLSVERFENNVVARTTLGRSRRVVLAGHLDTVPANDNERAEIVGSTLRGLGAADMKGGLAAMLALAEAASHDSEGLALDLTVVFYEGEEVADEFNGLGRLFTHRPELAAGDFAVALEPTDGRVEAGCQGTIHLRVTTNGARAHSARPWMGDNAIHAMVPVVERVSAFGTPRVEIDGLEYREAMQVVRIEGGIANNVVPDRCSIVVNRRYAPRMTLEHAVEESIALLVGDTTSASKPEVELVAASGGAHPNLGDPLVAGFIRHTGVEVLPKLGWTDVARFAAHGIPAVNFGPGDPAIAHTAGEWVDGGAIERCRDLLDRYLRSPR